MGETRSGCYEWEMHQGLYTGDSTDDYVGVAVKKAGSIVNTASGAVKMISDIL
jgi:hypothetical protein